MKRVAKIKKRFSEMTFFDIFSSKKIPQEEMPKVIVDNREKQSLIPSELIKNNCEVEFRHLEVGDYIAKNTIIERKTINDFISSMVNKRLLKQMDNLKDCEKKLLIIEGVEEKDIYNMDNGMNENAIRGFILSILLNYKVPIIFTRDYGDSAKFIKTLANKPDKEREISTKLKRKAQDKNEKLSHIIEGFQGIGPKNAQKLLNKYGTIKEIINAPVEDLEKLIGKKARVFDMVNQRINLD